MVIKLGSDHKMVDQECYMYGDFRLDRADKLFQTVSPFKPFVENPPVENALAKQVGGSHYKEMAIQPIEYILANKLDWCEGNIVKYVTRHHQKGGKADIEKVIHYAQLLLETQYK